MRVISAVSPNGFYRCGMFFPHDGKTVAPEDFTDTEWKRLMEEPNLRIQAASEAEAEAAETRKAMIAEVIDGLGLEGFTKDGKPKLELLNAALEEDLGKIDKAERDIVFGEMVEAGFEHPTNET